MAAGDNYFSCAEHKTLDQVLREMIVIDDNGAPVFAQVNPISSKVSQEKFLGAVSSDANADAFEAWKVGAGAEKRVLRVTPMNISATVSGLVVEYTD